MGTPRPDQSPLQHSRVMEDFGEDHVSFDALDAELANINDKFDRGKMRAFGTKPP